MERKGAFAILNEKGMDIFGEIFPNGEVPITSILQVPVEVKGFEGAAYLMDYHALTEEKQKQVKQYMVEEQNIPEEDFPQLLEQANGRIPLRSELVKSSYDTNPAKYL